MTKDKNETRQIKQDKRAAALRANLQRRKAAAKQAEKSDKKKQD